jgi:hypothetical protein
VAGRYGPSRAEGLAPRQPTAHDAYVLAISVDDRPGWVSPKDGCQEKDDEVDESGAKVDGRGWDVRPTKPFDG